MTASTRNLRINIIDEPILKFTLHLNHRTKNQIQAPNQERPEQQHQAQKQKISEGLNDSNKFQSSSQNQNIRLQ